MTFNPRSIDDQPLAAYSRGTIEPIEEIAETAAADPPPAAQPSG